MYWNRRDAAVRIGGPSLSEAVFRMMFATKEATGLATVSDSSLTNQSSVDLGSSLLAIRLAGNSRASCCAAVFDNAIGARVSNSLFPKRSATGRAPRSRVGR